MSRAFPRAELKTLYESMINFHAPLPSDEDIDKDIYRTFPEIPLFASQAGVGQKQLRTLLRAYTALKTDVGYTQGMNFVAGYLLRHIPCETDAFFVFVCLMHAPKWNLMRLYSPGLAGLHDAVEQLDALAKAHVPEVYDHLESSGLTISLLSQRWFLSLFTVLLGTSEEAAGIITNLWDLFFAHGWAALLAFSVELLRQLAPRILGESFDEIIHVIENMKEGLGSVYENVKEGSEAYPWLASFWKTEAHQGFVIV